MRKKNARNIEEEVPSHPEISLINPAVKKANPKPMDNIEIGHDLILIFFVLKTILSILNSFPQPENDIIKSVNHKINEWSIFPVLKMNPKLIIHIDAEIIPDALVNRPINVQ